MKILPFLFLALFLVCFMGCDGKKDTFEPYRQQAEKLKVELDRNAYIKGCEDIKEKMNNDDNLKKYIETDGFLKLAKDSLDLDCNAIFIKNKYGPYNINVYLENSRNMDGFLYGNTDFKRNVSRLLNDIATANKGSNQALYHINNKINKKYSNRKIDDIVRDLDYWNFKSEGGDSISRKFPSLKNIIDIALSKTNDSSISIIISDFGLVKDIPDSEKIRDPHAYTKFVKTESDRIKNSIKERNDLSLLVLRQESVFKDCYYDVDGKCYVDSLVNEAYVKECIPNERAYRYRIAMEKICEEQEKEKNCHKDEPKNMEIWEQSNSVAKKICSNSKSRIKIRDEFSRPYLVWIFGTNQQIEQVLKTPFIAKAEKDSSSWLAKYIRNNSKLRKIEVIKDEKYEDNEFVRYKALEDSIYVDRMSTSKVSNPKLEIPIRLNFGEITKLLPEMYYDKANYKLNRDNNFYIKELSKNNNKWTHSIVIESMDIKDNNSITTERLISDTQFLLANINIKKDYYSWIGKYSCEIDTLFANNYKAKQTRGLKILLENIHDIFYEHPLDSFTIKIGVKK